jgi:uncharacterized protein YaiL (DUF2058 family)
MTNSLRDQLLGLGFKSAPKPERREPPRDQARPAKDATHAGAKRHGDAQRGHDPNRGAGNPRSNPNPRGGRPPNAAGQRPAQRPARGAEMDLGKAYAIRAQKEKDERIAAEKTRQEEAARRREGKTKLTELLKTATLNDAAAEIARHFEYGGKIRRIYVTPDQLRALNGGELAVVQLAGRYHLVSNEHATQAETLMAGALALRVDPAAGEGGEDYSDSRFQVPDDLVW